MSSVDVNRRRIIFKSIFSTTTALCFGFMAWALRQAYLHLHIPEWCWKAACVIGVIYLICAITFIARQERGFHRFFAHSLLLQLAPILVAVVALILLPEDSGFTPIAGPPSRYERSFNDLQDKQKAAALANGLAPFKSRADIEEQYSRLHRKNRLVKIESNQQYVVRELTYSSPYVVPKVEELLDEIASRFQEKTNSKARFVVTSVLRTEEDVKRLRKVNGNASTASCHCNATTIDISYVRFENDDVRPRGNYDLRMALAQTLHELRKAGRCYVKIERKQYCYHITVR